MKVLTKVLVGSRLHGLNVAESDYDWRGIHMHPLREVLSPFKKIKNTSWIEGNEDNISYELADFCKLAVQGNATILEVFFSNKIKETTPTIDKMRENWKKFIDTDRFVEASRGYAHNQYNKMHLFEPDARTPKFAVAYLRVLWQAARFLETGQFQCEIDEPELRQFLMAVKYKFNSHLVPKLTEEFYRMQGRVTEAYRDAEILKPDINWIEEFIYEAYLSND